MKQPAKQQAFWLNQERYLEPCTVEEILASGAAERPPCWIDLQHGDIAKFEQLLVALQLPPLAIEACLEALPISRVVAYSKSLFIGLPIHSTWDAEERTYLWIVCLPRILITIHKEEMSALQNIAQHYSDGMRFHGTNTSSLLYQIFDYFIDDDMAFTLRTRDEINLLDEQLENDADEEWSIYTVPLKRKLVRLAAVLEDQQYCIGSLQTIDSESFEVAGLQDYFRDAISHLEHASRASGRQLAHLYAIQQEYQLQLQSKANNRLRLLTIVSTIFIPLTLITGVYGMNFHGMPELSWTYGYLTVLLLMSAIVVAMLWGFWRTGWFK